MERVALEVGQAQLSRDLCGVGRRGAARTRPGAEGLAFERKQLLTKGG